VCSKVRLHLPNVLPYVSYLKNPETSVELRAQWQLLFQSVPADFHQAMVDEYRWVGCTAGPNPVQESIAAQVIKRRFSDKCDYLLSSIFTHQRCSMVFRGFPMAFPWLSALYHVTCSFTSSGAVSVSVTELPPSK
jgi:hypothetical protein